MNNSREFQRIVGITALLVTLFIVGNVITLFASVNNNTQAFSDAARLLAMGAGAARLFHISMVFDVLAYLMFAPLVVFCWSQLRPRSEGLASLFAFCGLSYSLLGSLGGVVVDALLPSMMSDYAAAAPAQQDVLRLLARYSYLAVAHGVWNPLEVLMVSVWFLGFGLFLLQERRGLAILALVLAGLGLLDPIGWIFGSDVILNIGGLGTALLPIWTACFGVHLLRSPAGLLAAPEALHAG